VKVVESILTGDVLRHFLSNHPNYRHQSNKDATSMFINEHIDKNGNGTILHYLCNNVNEHSIQVNERTGQNKRLQILELIFRVCNKELLDLNIQNVDGKTVRTLVKQHKFVEMEKSLNTVKLSQLNSKPNTRGTKRKADELKDQ
jgi:hypothetical protein